MSSTAVASIAGLTSSEMDQARMYLDHTFTNLVGAIRQLSPAQWHFKPAADRWSIAENVDHIAVVQSLVIARVRDILPTAPAGDSDRAVPTIDAIVLGRFPHRFGRYNAPEFVQPKGTSSTPKQAIAQLAENTAELTRLLESTPDLRLHVLEAAPLKAVTQGQHTMMDGYQWILTAAAHTERHTFQILEVMADANFPER